MIRGMIAAIAVLIASANQLAQADSASLVKRLDSPMGELRQEVTFHELWIDDTSKRVYPQKSLAIVTDWSEGATMFGTVCTFLKWDINGHYDKYELSVEDHANGEGGGGHRVRWWRPCDVDDDTADEALVLEVSVAAGIDYKSDKAIERGWRFMPSKTKTDLYYIDVDDNGELAKLELATGQAIALLNEFAPDSQAIPNHNARMRHYWARYAETRLLAQQGETEKAKSLRSQLVKEIAAPGMPNTMTVPTTTRPETRGKQPGYNEINVYNPLTLKLTLQAE